MSNRYKSNAKKEREQVFTYLFCTSDITSEFNAEDPPNLFFSAGKKKNGRVLAVEITGKLDSEMRLDRNVSLIPVRIDLNEGRVGALGNAKPGDWFLHNEKYHIVAPSAGKESKFIHAYPVSGRDIETFEKDRKVAKLFSNVQVSVNMSITSH